MPDKTTLGVYFHRNDGHRERIPLPQGTIVEAVAAIERVFYISDGLYTKAEIYRGDELVEMVANTSSVHAESILIQ